MVLSVETIEKILGIKGKVDLMPSEMAKNLKVTFCPREEGVDKRILEFGKRLEKALNNIGAKVIPYEEALEQPSFSKIIKRWFLFFRLKMLVIESLKSKEEVKNFKKAHSKKFFRFVFGKKIKRGIAVVSLGEGREGGLPMDYTTSFKENPIITVVTRNKNVNEQSDFKEHMEEALGLFAWDMTNLVISIDESSWTIYSFNLSNPTIPIDNNFDNYVLSSLIPKIAAPVVPPAIKDFTILENDFSPKDAKYTPCIKDLVDSGFLLEKTELYPAGRKIDSLKFRNYFYRWIGAIHLDERNGMSYGFLARQLPVKMTMPVQLDGIGDKELQGMLSDNEHVFYEGESYVKINVREKDLVVKIPEIWVLTSRSGANKTSLDPKKDIIKMGLKNGKMFLGLSKGIKLSGDYKPSFDTKIILSHAVANAIFGSLIMYFRPDWAFPKILHESGFAIAHWHGYVNPEFILEGWIVYGAGNPSVSCSSPQSAIYAFEGKQTGIINSILNDAEYKGDIHIEPHHGTNIAFPSLKEISEFLLSDKNISKLGSAYLNLYK